MARWRWAGRSAAAALASCVMACNAFDDASPEVVLPGGPAGAAFPVGGRPPSVAGAGGSLSPGLGRTRDAAVAGPGDGATGVDAAVPVQPRDAGGDGRTPCPGNPPGCARLDAHLVTTDQPCVLELTDVRVEPMAVCLGEVVLDGVLLRCGDANGWTATTDGTLLVLLGQACTTYLDGADTTLSVTFPCATACRVGGEEDAGVE